MLKHFLNPPNWFTSAGLFCGLYAIVLGTGTGVEQDFGRAAVMILFAGVFDMLDGRVARITKTGSEFGVQLDSLVDMVCFGVAPALLLYAWGIHVLGTAGLVAAFAFVLCGAFRLARFNITHGDGKVRSFSQGLTITTAGGTVATAVWAHAAMGRDSVEHPANVLALTLVLAFLMVSRVPYRTFKARRSARASVIGAAFFMAFMLAVSLRYDLSVAFLAVATAYVASGPVELLFSAKNRRYLLGKEED